MKISVTLTANAGVAIEAAGYKIWVDAVHNQHVPGFSSVNEDLFLSMLESSAFAKPDFMVFTHCHPDHFSRDFAGRVIEYWPDVKPVLPEQYFDSQIHITGERFTCSKGEVVLEFLKLPHEGIQYASCMHYGLCIRVKDKRIVIPADCKINEETLVNFAENADLALLNFPWLTLNKAQKFVCECLRPKYSIFFHLPFANDDMNGYRQVAERAINSTKITHASLLWQPLQSLELDI